MGHTRCGFQLWHRHISHLPSPRFHKQRPSYECRLEVPCQSKCVHLRVRAVLCGKPTGCLLDRHRNRLPADNRKRKSSANHFSKAPTEHTLDVYVCQSRLRWPTGRWFGAHQATPRSRPLSAKHHHGSSERSSDGGQIQYQPLRLCERRLARRLGLNLYQIDVPAFVSAVEYMDGVYAEYPDFRESFLAIDLYAERVVQSIPDDATAYPYRNAVSRL